MAVDISAALSKAYEDLRTIDSDLSVLSGIPERFNRKRTMPGDDHVAPSFSTSDRRVQDGGRKIIIGPESSDRYAKRGRYAEDGGGPLGSSGPGGGRDYSPPRSSNSRTLQSSVVVMPTIETKSRAAVINALKKSENKEDQVRNRRLFGNLVIGTLRQFQKEEKTVGNKGLAQIEKQREVERRLEETEKENRNRMLRERETLMAKRREKEAEIQSLRRQKAIEQSAEEKTKHFRRLQCFIQTQTKPPLFFLPAKHTLRTLELLKESSQKIETLIGLRREEMDRELRRLEQYTTISMSRPIAARDKEHNGREDDHDEEEDEHEGEQRVKSAVVVKTEETEDKEAEEEMREEEEENGGHQPQEEESAHEEEMEADQDQQETENHKNDENDHEDEEEESEVAGRKGGAGMEQEEDEEEDN